MQQRTIDCVHRPVIDAATVSRFVAVSYNGSEELVPVAAAWVDPSLLRVQLAKPPGTFDTTQVSVNLVNRGTFFQRGCSTGSKEVSGAGPTADAAPTQGCNVTMRIRLIEQGNYTLRLRMLDSNDIVAQQDVHVGSCGEEATLVSSGPNEAKTAKQNVWSTLHSHWPTVAATGQHGGIRISNNDLPAAAASALDGAWSVTMWLFLVQRTRPEQFASFLYKGTGNDQQRTPSVWMIPGGQQTCIKLSTLFASDSGADSDFHVPIREWTHVTVAATNSSAENTFSVSIFVNGKFSAGISMADNTAVVWNNGSLWLGKDPSFSASPILMAGLQLREGPMGELEAEQVFQENPLLVENDRSTGKSEESALFASVRAATQAMSWSHHEPVSTATPEMQDAFETAQAMTADCGNTDVVAMGSLFALACDEGRGVAAACREYGLLLLQPVRAACPAEMNQYAAQHAPAAQSLMGSLLDGSRAARQEAPRSDEETEDGTRALLQRDTVAARRYLRMAAHRMDARAVYYWGLLCMHSIGSSHSDDSRAFNQLLGSAQLDRASDFELALAAAVSSTASPTGPRKHNTGASSPDMQVGIGLLHVAAALGEPRAWAALAWRYNEGYQVPKHERTAAMYYGWTTASASNAYFVRGQQPFHEVMRLNMDTIDWVEYGQRGDDDEAIQLQLLQAQQGSAAAQSAMADLYYWGARGLERDQAAAGRFWEMAAEQGDVPSMSALGGLYLKGEGVEQSNETALYWYERAAEHEHVRALNGLGAMYFQANGVQQNYTKAFHYFKRAAEKKEDGDSLFNLAHCYREGLGVNQSWEQANHWAHLAAIEFGNFGAIVALAEQYAHGNHMQESAAVAISYYKAAAAMGEWGATPRRGFDRYLARDYSGAALEYLEAFHLGQEAGASNAAYLLDRKLASWVEITGAASPSASSLLASATEEQALSLPAPEEWAALQPVVARTLYQFSYDHGASDVALALGDYHFFGTGGARANVQVAMGLYAIAAGNGNAQAAYNLGYLYEQGVGLAHPDDARALLYYQKVMELSPPTSGMAHALPVYAAMARIHARRAVKNTPWLHNIVSCIPGLSSLLKISEQGAFASAVPGGMVDESQHRAAGAGASHLAPASEDPTAQLSHTHRYFDAANSLASSWASRWVRSALEISPQESEEQIAEQGAAGKRPGGIVDAIKHPRRALLRLFLEHGLPTVYVHYLWAVLLAVLLSTVVAATTFFSIVACRRRGPNAAMGQGSDLQAAGAAPGNQLVQVRELPQPVTQDELQPLARLPREGSSPSPPEDNSPSPLALGEDADEQSTASP